MGKRDEHPVGDPLIVGWDIWDFYRDTVSDCFVARQRGNEDQPHVAVRYEDLRDRIKSLYDD
jgi:hypothetical protein